MKSKNTLSRITIDMPKVRDESYLGHAPNNETKQAIKDSKKRENILTVKSVKDLLKKAK